MTDEHANQRSGKASATLSGAVFDDLYQGRGLAYGDGGARIDVIPWQLDGPQPLIVEVEEAGEITDPVLECGCGLGENALYLARRGHQVTAFDAAATAIEQDRAKASSEGIAVTFVVADATTLTGLPGGFRTVIDSAMLHCLTDEQRLAYLAALRNVLRARRPDTRPVFPGRNGGHFPDARQLGRGESASRVRQRLAHRAYATPPLHQQYDTRPVAGAGSSRARQRNSARP